jgi:hypothetical protein
MAACSKRKSWWAAVGVITAVMMIAAGCSRTSSAQPKPPGSTVNVSATRPAILQVGSAAVSLPAGAVAGHGKLAGRILAPPAGPPDGTTFASPVYDFEVGGTVLTGQANLTLPVTAATPAGAAGAPDVAVLVYWDATQRAWTPLTTATYDKATRTVAGPSRHLSIWAVLRVNATSILAAVSRALLTYVGVSGIAPQPKCPGADPVAARGVNVVSDKGSIVEWCAGVSTGSLQLVIANNREYALEADYPAAWTMQRIDPPGPIFDQAVASLSQMLTQPISGDTPVIIPGGQSIRITVPIGAAGEVRTRPTPGAYLLDALIYGADTLAMTFGDLPGVMANPSLTAKAISLAFTVEGCSRTFDALAHNDISSASAVVALFRTATDLAVGCLADQWKAAYGLAGQASTFYIGVLLWLRDGLRLVMQGLEAALETGIYWRSYRIAVYSTVPPTTERSTTTTSPTCTGQGLAMAAHAYQVRTGSPTSASALTGFVCVGGYAAAMAATTAGGGYGFALSFRAAGSGWTVISSGNLLPPTGLPSSIYSQLKAGVQNLPQDQSYPF